MTMKKLKLIALGFLALIISCSNPNKEFVEKIKLQVKEDALGVEMHYKSINFQWTDTLFVKEKLSGIKRNFDERLNTILGLENFLKKLFNEESC